MSKRKKKPARMKSDQFTLPSWKDIKRNQNKKYKRKPNKKNKNISDFELEVIDKFLSGDQ